MEILQILTIERNNKGDINLLKEGLFWRAYEQSAFLFSSHIKAYSVRKKFYKNVGCAVVYLGFPDSVLESLLSKLEKTIVKNEKHIIIKAYEYEQECFENWKSGIETNNNNIILQHNDIVNSISQFDILNKTPFECQQFLVNLQNEIKNDFV